MLDYLKTEITNYLETEITYYGDRPYVLTFLLVLLALIVLFFIKYKKELEPRLGTLEWIQTFDRPKFSLDGRCHPMERRDLLPMLLITAVYALVAFTLLGSTEDPQTFHQFTEDSNSVIIDLGEQHEISSVMYYAGLYPGDYDLYASVNGSNWILEKNREAEADDDGNVNDASMPQAYSDLFKWQYAHLNADILHARYLKIVARKSPMELGEIAVFDVGGNQIALAGIDSLLVDEQSVVPDEPSWFNSMYFDEVYHGRTAYEFEQGVYPYEITHPPLGKVIIEAGVILFGMTPFGYRFMGTLFGVLMLLPLYILIKNLFGKTKVAFCGTAVFAFDFMHYVQTRIATIDTYSVFFTLVAFLFMWRWMAAPYDRPLKKTWKNLALSGLFFGIGCACKWTVIYSGGGLAVLWVIRVIAKYRAVGLSKYGKEFAGTVLLSVLFFILVPVGIYCLSYIPYALCDGQKFPQMLVSSDYYKLIWDNQTYMFSYHQGVHQDHPYASRWYQWLFDLRPILYYLDYKGEVKSAFGCFNSPLVAWAGLVALISLIPSFFKRRKPAAVVIFVGYLSQFLPWLAIGRTTFEYHYFGCTLFLCLAIAFVFNQFMERSHKNVWILYAFTGVNTGLFALFYPVLSGITVSRAFCESFLKWFQSWPWG